MDKFQRHYITIAANDSTEELKSCADIVCEGSHDELTIQKIIDKCAEEKKDIFLLNGTYHIDGFYDFGDGGPKAALRFPNNRQEISFSGQKKPYGKKDSGVILYVTPLALEQIDGEGYDVIRTVWKDRGLGSCSALYMENFDIQLSHNQKPIRCIDLRRCDRPSLKM